MSETGKSIDLGQPIDGLLYDLNLLPEQLEPNTREYQLMWVITELKSHLATLELSLKQAREALDRIERTTQERQTQIIAQEAAAIVTAAMGGLGDGKKEP